MLNLDLSQTLQVGIVSPSQMIANFVVAIIISVLVALVYKRSHQGVSYSRGFVLSLVMVGVVMAGVMMVIGNSLARAFGLFGAFSLVRFRSAIKDPRDIAFVFWSLIEGMAAGTANYELALLLFLMMTFLVLILEKYQFGSIRKTGFTLALTLRKSAQPKDVGRVEKLLEKYCRSFTLITQRKLMDSSQEWIYSLILTKDSPIGKVVQAIERTKLIQEVKVYNNTATVEM